MSMVATLQNIFSSFDARQRARQESERVVSYDEEESVPVVDQVTSPTTAATVASNSNPHVSVTAQSGSTVAPATSRNSESAPPRDSHESRESELAVSASLSSNSDRRASNTVATATAASATTSNEAVVEEEAEEDADMAGITIHRLSRSTMTLAELEEERELARRRSSACVLLAVFVLFRLWIEAIQDADFGLLLLCLVGTSWTARWIRHNRDREEELDRRIASYLEGPQPGSVVEAMDRHDLRMLSFQAQLALAIMESQRQMMEGGYGHPDGYNNSPGVSEEAKARWERFAYQTPPGGVDKTATKGNSYGSVGSQKDSLLMEDGPHCSICLAEYEDGDSLVNLPCKHLYHEECIQSWTNNHTRCPLCNYDLEQDPAVASSQSTPEASPPSIHNRNPRVLVV